MATKNIGYGAVCNTNRLHAPLFLDVCVEVLAFRRSGTRWSSTSPTALRSQYDGGPGPNAKFAYIDNRSTSPPIRSPWTWSATTLIVAKRKEMGVTVNENPRFTEYLRYAEKLGLGIVDPAKIKFSPVKLG